MTLKSNIPQLRAGLRAAVRAGVKDAAELAANLATQLVPVDSGDLKRSITTRPGKDDLTVEVVAGGGGVGYAGFVEYGTVSSPAQPFLTPAVRAIKPQVEIARQVFELMKRSAL